MLDLPSLAAVAATFLLGGMVKGVIGLGLPSVSIALLTAMLGLPHAMALMIVPTALTNLWQALSGGHGREILVRVWPFLLTAAAMIWVGTLALSRVDLDLLSILLGAVLGIYALVSLFGLRMNVPPSQDWWIGPLCGALNGLVGGMTGAYAVPGVMYLQGVGMPRDMLVQAMGMLFGLSTVTLGLSLGGAGFLDARLGLTSLFAVLPALVGMAAGQSIRHRLPEAVFRRVFFVGLMVLGAYIALTAALGLG